MRNNKNKGFTLVELLVVIAILAILATVSVVGYTSFIESATVSNDENI
ncbi:MAG: prepilin-type N-terminal cleavage/methylation domain-containing protein, partial [Clostridia bacterium]|nr:prepilin-type N-terminal cleavage/methylation domain-containing protein [Clostridia bacterium]